MQKSQPSVTLGKILFIDKLSMGWNRGHSPFGVNLYRFTLGIGVSCLGKE